MGIFSFDEDDNQEPTFSLHDFKKWLSKQGKADKQKDLKIESEETNLNPEEEKEAFKNKLRKRRKSKKKEG